MNRTFPCRDHRDTARSGRRRLQRGLRRFSAAWAWLLVLVVAAGLATTGCGGGGDEPDPGSEEAPEVAGPPEMGPPAEAAKKPAAKEKPKEEEKPLPEQVSDWVTEDYYQARRKRDERLPEAVAYLGEHFAGTDQADSAATLLTNLLKKSEEPEPKKKARAGGPMGYPGAGGPMMSAPGSGGPMMSAPGSGGPMMSYPSGDESGYMEAEGEGEDMDDSGLMYSGGAEGEYTGEYSGDGMMRSGYGPSGYGPGAGPSSAQRRSFAGQLIKAVVGALGVNDSKTARKTLAEVVEGAFETDDNRLATITTLQTFVAHLCPEYEALLYRCLTEPDKMRTLGKRGQGGVPGRGPMMSDSGMYGPGYPGSGSGSGRGPLTAEELQRQAFSLIGPQAPPEFRAKLAGHLAKPDTPQEDVDLFINYLTEADPENVSAQMVLYLAPAIDAQTKEMVEANFLTFSSDALAGILGVPVDKRARRPTRRRDQRGSGMYSGDYPEMDEGYMESPDAGMMYSEPEEEEPHMDPGMMMSGPPSSYPGSGAQPGRPRDPSGRPSRYDSQQPPSGRPSRYGTGEPGGRAAAVPELDRPDPDLPYRLAAQMWADQMSKLVESRLNQVDSLDSGANLVLLASTMPVDSTRSTLYQMLQRRWEDGPGALESAGLLDEVVSDPGFLVLVKMLPRKAPPEQPTGPRPGMNRTRQGRAQGYRGEYGDEGAPSGPMMSGPEGYMDEETGPGGPGRRPGQTPQEPDLAWMATSEELVRAVSERLLAAARGLGGAGRSEGEMPFEIRADANVVAEYHLDWPATSDQKLSGVPLGRLKLHYLRAELDTRLSTLESYYKRQLGSHELRSIHNGSWMESLSTVPDTDWKRSIDLMFTATVPAGEQLDKRQELPITVDVLCIDIQDPQQAAAGN